MISTEFILTRPNTGSWAHDAKCSLYTPLGARGLRYEVGGVWVADHPVFLTLSVAQVGQLLGFIPDPGQAYRVVLPQVRVSAEHGA